MLLRYVYVVFLGILLALFVGVGIAAFYEQPKSPTPTFSKPLMVPESATQSATQDQEWQRNNEINEKYMNNVRTYNRNVSIAAIIFAVFFLILSFTVLEKILVMADGFLLGGLFTLLYSIIRGFDAQDSKFRFIIIAVALIVACLVGYKKFIMIPGKR